jgi:hypothetical protein
MSGKRLFLAGGILALASASADAALVFSLERVPSASGASGPSTVLLVARDPEATASIPVAGLSGKFTNLTTKNGLKFYVVTDPDAGTTDVSTNGGVGDTGFGVDAGGNSLRTPLIKGSFLDVASRTVAIVTGKDQNGNEVDNVNNVAAFQQGIESGQFLASRGNNTAISVAALTSKDGAVLGAAVVSSANDVVTFTDGTVSSTAPAPATIIIPNLSTSAVPEPTGLAFLGLVGTGALIRRRRRQA